MGAGGWEPKKSWGWGGDWRGGKLIDGGHSVNQLPTPSSHPPAHTHLGQVTAIDQRIVHLTGPVGAAAGRLLSRSNDGTGGAAWQLQRSPA